MKKIKFFFVAMGPGETGHARALAKYISEKGGRILFAVHQKINLHFVSGDKEFKIYLTENPEKLKGIVEKENPRVLLLFNSKIWGGEKEFLENPPFKKPPLVLTFDSNWLFNEKKYPTFPFIKWADKYLIVFPKKIFELGLKENGGDFEIEKSVLEKIIPVGFIPSHQKPPEEEILKKRKEYGIGPQEKVIFSYFSGFGATHRIWAFENFIKAMERLVKKIKKVKAIYVGPTEDLNQQKLKRDWLIIKQNLSAEDYFLTLAGSDLVFQHQGMVTLSQAISCQIPVIANVSILKGSLIPKLHFWEVEPFFKIGTCQMFSRSTKIEKISKGIEELLFNTKRGKEMQKVQKSIYEEGEKRSFKIINKLLKEKL